MSENLGVVTFNDTAVQLSAGGFPVVRKPITIANGQGELSKGTVLGKIKLGALTSAAKSGGNTGAGTCVPDETTPILAGAKAGVYKVRITRAAIAAIGETSPAMLAIASVTDPDGNIIAVVDVPKTTGVTVSNQIKFVLTEDDSTLFALGDGFDITIAAGSGEYVAYDADNLNGSQVADCILGEAVDATSEAVKGNGLATGEFNEAALTGLDAAAKVQLAEKMIFCKKVY